MTVARILIIEDQEPMRRRLAQAIASHENLSVCGTAATFDQGMAHLFDLKPDFLLVDLGLPDGDGTEIIAAAQSADWHVDAMVLSVFGDERRVLGALSAGAKGYVLKGSQQQDICDAILDVLSGGAPISPQIARFLLKLVNNVSTGDDFGDVLTIREQDVLRLLSQGYKRQEAAKRLQISVGTLGHHTNAIYQKLHVKSSIEAILKADRMGLL